MSFFCQNDKFNVVVVLFFQLCSLFPSWFHSRSEMFRLRYFSFILIYTTLFNFENNSNTLDLAMSCFGTSLGLVSKE
jgi:hypothetical protein